MEKVYTLLWILVALGVFVWRMIQKARTVMAEEMRERPASTGKGPPLPATSFEEMLKQMQAQNRTGNPTTAAAQPLPNATMSAASIRNPRTELQPADQPAVPAAGGLGRNFGRRAPEQAAGARQNLADRLRNPADLRAAFVLGEILRRKF